MRGLKSGQLGGMAIDVYENGKPVSSSGILSHSIIEDDVIQRLVSFPNVILTAHQAFFTREALEEIMNTTLANVSRILPPAGRSRTRSRRHDHESIPHDSVRTSRDRH